MPVDVSHSFDFTVFATCYRASISFVAGEPSDTCQRTDVIANRDLKDLIFAIINVYRYQVHSIKSIDSILCIISRITGRDSLEIDSPAIEIRARARFVAFRNLGQTRDSAGERKE